MELVIAEKPSLAKEIAFALGNASSRNGYWEVGSDRIVTFCVGHLFEVCEMGELNPEWLKWTLDSLPMLPETLRYKPVESTRGQWETVNELIHRADVTSIVNACDAGREGELIFWLVYNHALTEKPVKRLWISSLTRDEIQKGFRELRPSSINDGLVQSAFLRQEADLLMGTNPTRCQTLVAQAQGATEVFSMGRVQTPTLALVVNRDLQIENFVPVPFWQIRAEFTDAASGVKFNAALCDAALKIKNYAEHVAASLDLSRIEASKDSCRIKSVTKQPVITKPPFLFDLTALQREMNKRVGMTSARTLELAQTLYEKKLLTYPRTSSSHLSHSVADTDVPNILETLTKSASFGVAAGKILENDWKLTARHVDDKKITDHHALIPTPNQADLTQLSGEEKQVYQAVVKRFISAFYPNAEDERTVVAIEVESFLFVAKGTVQTVLGWRAVEEEQSNGDKKESGEEEEAAEETEDAVSLPKLEENSAIRAGQITLLEKKTKPPLRHTEYSLLAAMETAGKVVEDEEARLAMKELGLGTSGTRAETIEKLIRINYLERDKKQLKSTVKARQLIVSEQKVGSVLVSPELTGKWESLLAGVAAGKIPAADFRNGVRKLVAQTVTLIKSKSGLMEFKPAGQVSCPQCLLSRSEAARGHIKPITAKESKKKYLVCSLGKETCSYISQAPTTKKHLEILFKSRCKKCKSAMTFKLSKEKQTPFLSCSNFPKCDGIEWLESSDNKKQQKQK